MIRFSDASGAGEQFELSSPESGIRKIKPTGDISKVEAQDFWDEIFSKPIEYKPIIEAEIEADVYGRSEEEFTFDFNIEDDEVQGALSRFREPAWNELSVDEKKLLVNEFAGVLEERIGIKNSPAIEFYESDPSDCGYFDPEENTINVNETNFNDPQEIVDTVAHEMRHAYQYERAQKLETYEDFLYAYNFANYISPYMVAGGHVNFLDYQDQIIEAEARAFARQFVISEED